MEKLRQQIEDELSINIKANPMEQKVPLVFTTDHRAKFFEIDPYGHLNTTHYVTYFLEHRFTGLRENIGYDLKTLSQLDVAFFTKKLEVDFLRPITGDEAFKISSTTAETTEFGALVTGQAMKTDDKIAALFRMTLVCVNKTTGRPTPWPEDVIGRFYLKSV